MSYLKDREIWLSSVPTGNPPTGYVWVFIQNGVFVVRDSNGVDKIMASTTGTVTNATSASYVEYSNVANKPALISGSSQVSYTGLSDIPAGIVSSSVQIGEYGVFATTGSNQFNGSQAITGSLTVTGQVVAQTLNVQQVTSSIVYSSGSNVFGNSLSNTQQFTGSLQVSGSSHYVLGNVGIGTTDLSEKLTVNGNILLGGDYNLAIDVTTNGNGKVGRTDRAYLQINRSNFEGFLSFHTTSTGAGGLSERMRITSGGNVGIGTSAPTTRLDIGNGTLTLPTLRGRTYQLSNVSSANPNFITGTGFNSIPVRVGDIIDLPFGQTRTVTAVTDTQLTVDAAWTVSFAGSNVDGRGGIVFEANNAERMRITSGGNVGIGTNNPATNLHVVKDSSSPIRMERTGASGGFVDLSLFGAGGSNYFALGGDRIHSGQINDLTTASAANVFIGADSNGITNVLHRSTSSLKYKIDIRDYDKGLDFIKTLRPVYYKGKTDGDKQFAGLIAEEVHASGLEEFVQYAQDGSPDSLAYTHITALLINGIKELKAKIESLEVENDNLKSRLEVLEQS
jgi:hypothetical protein